MTENMNPGEKGSGLSAGMCHQGLGLSLGRAGSLCFFPSSFLCEDDVATRDVFRLHLGGSWNRKVEGKMPQDLMSKATMIGIFLDQKNPFQWGKSKSSAHKIYTHNTQYILHNTSSGSCKPLAV